MNTFDNYELVTSVDLCNVGSPTKPVYQFLYASQLYGTLFGIYGQFDIEKSDDGTCCEVKGVRLKLLNYQGVLNIGFTTHELFYEPATNENGGPESQGAPKEQEERPQADKVYFGVRGASSIRDKYFELKHPIKVGKGEKFPLTFCRILYPLPDFDFPLTDGDDIDDEDTALRRLDKQKWPLNSPIPDAPFFDSEFRYRSGIDQYKHLLRPGMVTYDALSIESLESGAERLVSPRCHESFVNLYFNV